MPVTHRMTALVSIAFFASALIGCDNSKTHSRTFSNVRGDEGVTFTYIYKDDAILRQDTESKIAYKSMGAANVQQARLAIEPMVAQYAGITGATYSTEYLENAVIMRIAVDFSQINDADLCRLQAKDLNCEKPTLSLSESVEHRLAQGFVEVK